MRLALLPCLALVAAACAATPQAAPESQAPAGAGPAAHDVRILRDCWGVPHVFGATDPDVAYGLAWAHAEDDFRTIQLSLLAARGRLATVKGRAGATNDYLVALLRIEDGVETGYPGLAPDTRALVEAYAAGLNAYAAAHPDATLPGVVPVRGRDIVAGFAHKHALFILGDDLRRLFDEDRPLAASLPSGSNAFAVAPSRSADGRTRLAVNSHQPWEGPVAWYEAHVRSDTGWEAVGGLFPGSPVILHGHNRNLGWAHTVNRPDLVDVYALEVDPADPDRYRFDGEWRRLESRTAHLQVKLVGPLSWTFDREVLWSVYGPVVRRKDGTYAIRYAGMGEVRQVEQTYRMNRARNFAEWQAAMAMGALSMFNTVYADREGNIHYVYNASLPLRSPDYDWSGVVPGNTSETLWTATLPHAALPQVTNPRAGFVQNANSTPFRTTLDPDNPRPGDFAPSLGIETRMTNRALRLLERLSADDAIDQDEFTAIKYDLAYSEASDEMEAIGALLAAPEPASPLDRAARALLRRWDRRTDPGNRAAALAVLTLQPLLDARRDGRAPPDLADALHAAASDLVQHFGRLDVRWREVNRLRRGRLDLGLGGGPDVLHAIYGRRAADGRLVGVAGDSYVLLVAWGKEGVRSWSIHQYGSATLDATSPHYADQAVLFAKRLLKPVWLDEADIRSHLEREYRPGAGAG